MSGDDFYKQALSVVYLDRLGDHPQARTFVHDRTHQAQLIGVIPADRKPPADDSSIAIAVAPSGHWAGFATFYETSDGRLWLDVLWVEAAWRRRGVGRQLIEAVRTAARSAQLAGVALGHAELNAPMIALMQRAGWKVDHVVRSIPAADLLARTEG